MSKFNQNKPFMDNFLLRFQENLIQDVTLTEGTHSSSRGKLLIQSGTKTLTEARQEAADADPASAEFRILPAHPYQS